MPATPQQRKARTHAAILRAATGCFRRLGFADTMVEMIATQADVGVGSIYKHYGSKHGLLMAMMDRQVDAALARGDTVLANPGRDLITAVNRLLTAYLDTFFLHYDRELMRASVASAYAPPNEHSKQVMDYRDRFAAQVSELVRVLQDKGFIASDIDPDEAGVLLLGTCVIAFFGYLQRPDETSRQLARHVLERVALVVRSWN